MKNNKIAEIFIEMKELLDIKGDSFFRIRAYEKAARSLENSSEDVEKIYKEKKLEGLKKTFGVGIESAKKIEEYLKKNKIKKYENLKKETAIRQIIAYFFKSKGLSLEELKTSAKKRKIVYSRFTKPAKQLIDLAGSVEAAEKSIDTVAEWAKTRNLDYSIETIFKKWLELDTLKPKEKIKKPFYRGMRMVKQEGRNRWSVINPDGEWLEFAGKESEIEWRET